MSGPLLLVGCGKMGSAMLDGWLARGTAAADIRVVEPNAELAAAAAGKGVAVHKTPEEIEPGFAPACTIFAVKPQMMDAVVAGYAGFTGPDSVFLSIAAGTQIDYFKRQLGDNAVIVRAMPNTPAAVGRGMSVICADDRASPAQRATCEKLLEAVGRTVWIDDEELLHAVTAVSGGGPAYVFLLVECLAEAGAAAGLPAGLSMDIARATVAGSGALLDGSAEPASQLRQNVTSPGGTTAEALKVLMAEDGIQPIFTRAMAAAAGRSRELGG